MKTQILFLGLIIAVFCTASSGYADVPQMINYQGRLTDTTGNAIDTTVSMTFAIYTDSVGTDSVWSETQGSVIVEEGMFNVLLGSVSPITDSAFDGSTRYLGVKVGTDEEMSPRRPLVSGGYAFRAEWADSTEFCYVESVFFDTIQSDGDWEFSDNDIFRLDGNVGIGMQTPAEKLDVDGNIHASGTISSGNSITIDGENDKITASTGTIDFEDEKLITTGTVEMGGFKMTPGAAGYVLTSDGNGVGTWQAAGGAGGNWSVTDSVLYTNNYWGIARGGAGNVLYGNKAYTMVNLGVVCTTGTIGQDYVYSTLSGGWGNKASERYATVGGGRCNSASFYYTTVSGGNDNCASNWYSTVGGGEKDTASGQYTTIGGGKNNAASGDWGTIAGGSNNTAEGVASAVGGGGSNMASGNASTVGGGVGNTAEGYRSIVGGGGYNKASGDYSVVSGGGGGRPY